MAPPPKPRERTDSENQQINLSRYVRGGFGDDANATLGIDAKYLNAPQGLSVLGFSIDSAGQNAGLQFGDIILEVDGAAVGKIRGRFYEPWKKYGRSAPDTSEVLVTFVASNGVRKYYYPQIVTTPIDPIPYQFLPDDFFTSEKPRSRSQAESRPHNFARYVSGYGNIETFARYELGVTLNYSNDFGGTITSIKQGSAAESAGLQVGDHILEVDGAPVGKLGNTMIFRLYECWRQFLYSRTGKVELLVEFGFTPATGHKYYYPEIQLKDLTTPI